MKKGITLAAVAVAVAVGGTWFTKEAYLSAATDALARTAEKQSEFGVKNIVRTSGEQGFFSVKDSYTITFPAALRQAFDFQYDGVDDIAIIVNNDCTVFPFLMRCESTFSSENIPTLDKLSEIFNDYPRQAGWQLSPLTNSISMFFEGEAYSASRDGEEMSVGEIHFDSSVDLALSNFEFSADIDSVTIVDGDETTKIENVSMSSDLTDVQKHAWIGESAFSVGLVDVKAASGTAFRLEDMVAHSDTSKYKEDQYQIQYNIATQLIAINDGMTAIDAKDFNFDMHMYGITVKALDLINEYEQHNNPEKLVEVANELGKGEPGLTINDISVKVNDTSLSANTDVKLAPFTFDDIESMAIAQKIDLTFHADVGSSVNNDLPQLVPMLEQYVVAGMVKKDSDGNYVSDITLKDGALTANGNMLSQM